MAGPTAQLTTNTPTPIPQSNAGSGGNVAQMLEQVLGSNQAQLGELARKAATPIPAGHATSIPLTMDPTPRESNGAPYDKREVVGAGNAKAQGVGNSIIGVMNAIGATKTALDNKKRLEVASATQQLITAQQAYDQASQLVKSDPNNKDAAAAMERNKAVMNGILSNDKLRKAVEKGMNINFMDPSENDTLEHKGVADGKTMAKQHVDYAEQFNQQTPQVMGPNNPAIEQYKAAAAGQKLQVEAVRAMIPLLSAQVRAGATLKAAEMRQTYSTALAAAKSEDAWNRLQANLESRAKMQRDRHSDRLSEIAAEGRKDIAVSRQKMMDSDPTKSLKAYQTFQTQSAGKLAQFGKLISDLETERTSVATSPDQKGAKLKYKDIQSTVQALDEQLKGVKEAQSTYKQYVDNMNEMYKKTQSLYKGGEADAGADSSTSNEPDLNDSDVYADDESDNDN